MKSQNFRAARAKFAKHLFNREIFEISELAGFHLFYCGTQRAIAERKGLLRNAKG